jgi:tripartite ATP-independent transporter DctP family solute receptor
MRKIFYLVLVPCILGLMGCTKNTNQPADSGGKKAEKPVEINAGFGPNIDDPYGQGHVYWAKILNEQSGGTMIIHLFPNDQLGSGRAQIDQITMDSPNIFSTDPSFFADLGVPDMMIAQAPYIFKNWEEADKLMNSEWWASQEKLLEGKGIKVLARNWRYGDRHTITTKPVKHPSDFKGMKIRVPTSTVYVKAFEALGASPTPLALGEVYTALQQKVVEGLENPLATIYGGKYQEVAKYLLLDAHMKTINLVVTSANFFNSLTAEQRNLLVKTAKEAGEEQNRLAEAKNQEILDALIKEGVTVTEIDYGEFSEFVKGFYNYPEFSSWTPGLYQKVIGIIRN